MIGALSIAGQFAYHNPIVFEQIRSLASPTTPMVERASGLKYKDSLQDVESVPDHIIYFVLFNHLVGLQEQAQRVAADGGSLDYYKLYEEQARLDGNQSRLLFETANDCIVAVRQVDERAKSVIAAARSAFKNGKVSSPNDIPPPPLELQNLQQERNQTIIQFRDRLNNSFGSEKFNEFDTFARAKIIPNLELNITTKEVK